MGHFRKNLLTVFVNEFCNMHCIYCPLHAQSTPRTSRVIDPDFVKCGIDDFFSRTDSRGIRIFGNGEPTLSFKLLKEMVEYAYLQAGDRLFIELQTNGYFPGEVAHWVSEHVDMLWLSLDGPGDIQDRQRPTRTGRPSFPKIDHNIQIIGKSAKTTIGFRPTITDYSVDRQEELIDYAKANGVTTIYAYPWASFVLDREGQPDLMHFADKFIEAREYADKIGVYYGTIFMINFDEEVEINCRALLPAPHLTTDGFVSCCDMSNTGDGFFSELFPELIYGEYDKEAGKIHYYQDRIEKIRSRNIYNLETCRDCKALKHCAGGCIGSAMMTSGDFYGINPDYCKVTKYLFKRLPHLVNVGYNKDLPLHP
jgi:radical SAM protein with 4Fe4S-binding SPASM domain